MEPNDSLSHTILPIPQKVIFDGGVFRFDESALVLVPAAPSAHDLALARFLVAEISDRFGLGLGINILYPIAPYLVKRYSDEILSRARPSSRMR